MGQAASAPSPRGPPRGPRAPSATPPRVAPAPPRVAPAPPPPRVAPSHVPHGAPAQPKRIVVRTTNLRREKFTAPPKDAGVFYFETERGRRLCWKIGTHPAREFLRSGGIAGANAKFFKSSSVRIFFPIKNEYYVVRVVRGMRNITLEKIMTCIEKSAPMAVAYHIQRDLGTAVVTTEDVSRLLKRIEVCHLLLRRVGGGNHVYVQLSGSL
jgi:hypothetical protein